MVSPALLFFLTVVVIGGGLLVLINRPRAQAIQPTPDEASQGDLVQRLLAGDTLSASERRVWLDRFLAAQQDEEIQ